MSCPRNWDAGEIDISCSEQYWPPIVETDGYVLRIDGVYRGHIVSIGVESMEMEYRGENKLMDGLRFTFYTDRNTINEIAKLRLND